jgi:hypothetical protein
MYSAPVSHGSCALRLELSERQIAPGELLSHEHDFEHVGFPGQIPVTTIGP